LTSLITSSSTNISIPVYVPPPSHLAFISNLAVHPSYTTRAREPANVQVSSLALRYLKLVQKITGPVNARLNEAFCLSSHKHEDGRDTGGLRGGRTRRREGEQSVTGSGEEGGGTKQLVDDIASDLATNKAIWNRVRTFWDVAGWALSCSVKSKRRWRGAWSVWLEYMVDVLEDDWHQWQSQIIRDKNGENGEQPEEVKFSLLEKYISTSGGEKKIMRAIFADGEERAASEFTEVWIGETRDVKRKGQDYGRGRKKLQKLNIDEGEFGDYMDSSEDDAVEVAEERDTSSATSARRPSDDDGKEFQCEDDPAHPIGGEASLTIRVRLLGLLVSLSDAHPSTLTSQDTLFHLCIANIRPMPLPLFTLFLSPSNLKKGFTPAQAALLIQYLLFTLIQTGAPHTKKSGLNPEVLIKSYLPWTANTQAIVDNAKVSVCVESLARLAMVEGALVWSKELENAVRLGVKRREEKATNAGRRKGEAMGEGSEDEDRTALEASGLRLTTMVEILEMRAAAKNV